ncbi:hypothetical protein Gbem_4133 [Citrifermentans bemidjiense Bem]|uniref:Uncharacterized protein n=1 Tax=Citrifermentans bemidjiense (strain ATCC BAA-1014 / DSM 16622 / JCM 12645 / Bem) TaxID=404380 RepID=E1P6D4_CITBB|nr:hypothetical protein Gbem_4133 [Citrifermentans bemidjiense Bem]
MDSVPKVKSVWRTSIRTGAKNKFEDEIKAYQGVAGEVSSASAELKHKIFMRCVADHISGMTDAFANKQLHKLYIPGV